MNNKKISTISLVMIIFIGVFGFGNIANNFKEVGTESITMFIVGALLCFLPMCLIMAEFGAYAKDRTGGIYAWIELGVGPKIAYIAIWSYFVSNIFYLPTLATRVPTYISFILFGDANLNNIATAALATITMLVALLIGIKFEKGFNKVSTFVGYLSLFIAGIFLLGGAFVFMFGEPATPINASSFVLDLSSKSNIANVLSSFAWIIFAYGGSEICGSYIDKVENPEKNFVKGILGAAMMIGVLYIFGILAMASFGTQEQFAEISLVNAVISGYKFMGDKFALGIWFVKFIGFVYSLITLVALVLWSVSLSKSVFSEVPDGTFPHWLTKKNENGILSNALMFQTTLALLFIAITTFGGKAAGELYYKIYDMSTMSFLVPYMFLGIAYIKFRQSGKVSPFQAIKNNHLAIILGVLTTLMNIVALVFSGYNLDKPLSEQMDTIILYYGGLLFFLAIGLVLKLFMGKVEESHK